MIRFDRAALALAAALSLSAVSSTQAATYQFSFAANQNALSGVPDPSLDVQYAITLDDSFIPAFNGEMLRRTSTWLGGGVAMTVSHAGKTISINEALDPTRFYLSVPNGQGDSNAFLDTYVGWDWFMTLSFHQDFPIVADNGLPFDPFVNGDIHPYQGQQAYQDFRSAWMGNTAVLSGYEVASVPEGSAWCLMALGLGGLGLGARRRGRAAA